jgi:hypothetical protein
MAFLPFDAASVAPEASRELIPAGTYNARIIESDLKPLKSGNGDGLALTFEIIDGPHKNRRVWSSLNVKHTNPTAQGIAQQQLSSICHATGVIKLQDTSQLHNRPLKIRVKIRKDEQYGDKNEIGGYESAAGGSILAIQTQAPAPQMQVPATAAAKPSPWAK